ncbi:hypothetical protein OH687_10855 [Burkholderia anthina]|nr:hypothetical protein OH687_10855 [Burkholderia anthina]
MGFAGLASPPVGSASIVMALFLKGFSLFSAVFPPRRRLENSSGFPS